MARIEHLRPSISEFSQDSFYELLRTIRATRRTRPEKKLRAKTKAKSKDKTKTPPKDPLALAKTLSPEALASLFKTLEGVKK